MTVSELRAGIAANLATIPGLRTASYVPSSPKPPVAIVLPSSITFDTTFGRGMDSYEFTVLVMVGRVAERSSELALDAFCAPSGAGSIKTAIESDRTLGGKAFDLHVTGMRNYNQMQADEVTYLAAEFAVTVIAQ